MLGTAGRVQAAQNPPLGGSYALRTSNKVRSRALFLAKSAPADQYANN
jgi:hypothetical protein